MRNQHFNRPFDDHNRRWWERKAVVAPLLAGSLALAGVVALEKHDSDPCRSTIDIKADESGVYQLQPTPDVTVQLYVGSVESTGRVDLEYLATPSGRRPDMFAVFTSSKRTSTTIDLHLLDRKGPEVTYPVTEGLRLAVNVDQHDVLTTSCSVVPPVAAER